MRRGGGLIVVYLILALYLINSAFSIIPLPEVFTKIDKWVFLLSGIFLILGGINSLRASRYYG